MFSLRQFQYKFEVQTVILITIYLLKMQQMQFFDDQSQFKKYSKVSSALKCRLFRCIFISKMSIKASAKLCKLNYSTAKSLIKRMNLKQEKFISNQLNFYQSVFQTQRKSKLKVIKIIEKTKNVESSNCTFHQIISAEEQIKEVNKKQSNSKPILIFSSIGFDFFNITKECLTFQSKVNFSNPFENRKGFTSVINLNSAFNRKQSKQISFLQIPLQSMLFKQKSQVVLK